MPLAFDTGDIITGLIGLGLVAKGIMDKVYTQKSKERPCAIEHVELERRLDTLLTILDERKPR
jgi:hypothetical protein